MKKTSTLLLITALSSSLAFSQWVDLGSLGSNDFTIDGGSLGDYTQTPTQLTFNSFALGQSIYGFYTPSDWSSYSQFGVRINTASNPNIPFTFSIYDNTYEGGASGVNIYSGTTSVLDGSVITLTLISSTANLSAVVGVGFGIDGESSTPMTATHISAVPEPSTYALLALAGVALGGYAARRRKRS